MVLDQLVDGASRHLEFDQGTLQLIYILCLPLVDGVFASILVSGAIPTFSDMLAPSLTVFSGAGALAVLYSNSIAVREAKRLVLKAAPVLMAGAVLVGLMAPLYSDLFDNSILKYASGLTLLLISAKILHIGIADQMPPNTIMLTGMALSFQITASLSLSLAYLPKAAVTCILALFTLYSDSYLEKYDLNLKLVRLGGAAALSIIGASMFLPVPSEPSLLILAASFATSLKY